MKKDGKLPSVFSPLLLALARSLAVAASPCCRPFAHLFRSAFVVVVLSSESTENEFNYTGAAELFRNPEVTDPKTVKLEWKVSECGRGCCCSLLCDLSPLLTFCVLFSFPVLVRILTRKVLFSFW